MPTRTNRKPRLPPIRTYGVGFATVRKGRRRTFVPRGFNYDWTLLDGRAARLEDLLGHRTQKLDADFRDMRRLGANTVRVFLPIGTVLNGPTRANGRGLLRLSVLFGAAERHRLRLILTGLSLIRTADTPAWMKRASDETIERAKAFSESLGKTVVICKDQPGFLVNRMFWPYVLDAIRMYEAGVASKEDLDNAAKLGLNYPMGPLEVCDLVGLDIILEGAEAFYTELRDPRFAAPTLLRRMVLAGHLGRKSGKGFYDYNR